MAFLSLLAFKIARLPISRFWIGTMFSQFSDKLPLNYIRESDTLVAFHHPRPSYKTHILLVPKKGISSIEQLDKEDHAFLLELFQCVQSLVTEFNLSKTGYRLVANGGKYQEIPQLHFHLISEG